MASEQVTEKLKETVPDADTSYETGSVASTSISSQIIKVIEVQEMLVKLQLGIHTNIKLIRVLSWSPHLVNRIQKWRRRRLLMQILATKQAVCLAHPAHPR